MIRSRINLTVPAHRAQIAAPLKASGHAPRFVFGQSIRQRPDLGWTGIADAIADYTRTRGTPPTVG